MEGLATNMKKKGKPPPRQAHLEESIARHKAHITRLEQLLRLLDNEVRGVLTLQQYIKYGHMWPPRHIL